MADLGRAALVVSFGLALYALVGGTAAAITRQRRLADSARLALLACFGSTVIASAVLIRALVTHDFSYAYVQAHTSRDLSTVYSLTAFWGGEEGSLLLWLLVLTGYAALAVTMNRKLLKDIVVWVVPVIGGLATFFTFMLVAVASPFTTVTRSVDCAGLVPSLQNPYMVAHPPMLYLGYVGLSIPFAFAAGAMLSGHTDERWIVATRRWTLLAWMFLGFGQILGAHWAYEEVGWGGYYAWDPVENAALMPWLAATAFLHSVMIQEKRGMLKVWNMILVALAFNLSLFGTFLTRSGVIDSIHSFSQSPIGGWFLGFLAFMVVFSVALIYWRLPLLRTKTRLESLVSREATFLYNNLLLVALALTIPWGVLYPVLSEAVRGETRTVSKPYYDFFLHTFGLPLLLLMGIGPLVAWRRASLRSLEKTFVIPFAAAVVTGGVLLALGFGSSWPGLLTYTFSAFVAASIVLEFVRGRPAAGGIFPLIARNRRRYVGYIVHAAIVLLAIGIAGSSAYQTQREQVLRPGQSIEAAGYTLTYTGLEGVKGSNYTGFRALLAVSGHGERFHLSPGMNNYAIEGPSNEASIYHDPRSLGDVFTTAQLAGKHTNRIDVKVFVKPLVNLIWVAGFVFVAGALIAMWPDAVEQRRLAARYAAGAAPAGI